MATGSCLCNSVKFKVSGKTSDMQHCHCSMCRKVHGSVFATYFNVEHVEILEGEANITEHNSSADYLRSFCNSCGSPLPEKSNNSSGYFVPAGLMDDDLEVSAEKHIFTESKAACYTITDNLPQLEHYGDGDASKVIDVPTPTAKDGVTTGGCVCGAVNFEFTGDPNFSMNCHCTRCRKVKGAAHATNAFVDCDNLTWTSGEKNVTNFALPGAKFFGNAFCKTCGSATPRARADGSVYNVPVGSLNQTQNIKPKGHIFIGSKANWYEPTDDLPKWEEMPT